MQEAMTEELKTVRDAAVNGQSKSSQGWLIKSICKVLVELIDKSYHQEAKEVTTDPDSIKHYGDKPMKATIIYYLKDLPCTETISIDSHDRIAEAVSDWCKDQGCAPRYVHFVHYDGVLFEYTSKPVLAEVGTGIEI